MPNTIPTGGYGEWDWVLKNNNAPSGSYYFRMVFSNGSALETYTRYPLISSVGETNLDETHYQWLKDEAGGSVWTQATSAAQWTTRYDHTSVVYNNLMWVIGGLSSVRTNDVWYSSDGITWTRATSAAQWTARFDHTSVVYNNLMWVIGGNNAGNLNNDVWYSTSGVTWTQAVSAAQWTARR